ncbi:MAG: SDR family oxidoreductase [Gemmatimonadales bacterium]|nr:SDR family oxidoreductase [Gemmatimonadales bacterium]
MPDVTDRPLAVITGASAGLGTCYAERLAARGYDLLLVARDGARLEALGARLAAAHGVRAEAWPADLARADDLERLADALAARPRVDVLVNNAGFGTTGRLWEAAAGSQEAMLAVHVVAPMRLTRAVLGGMVARGRGAVVNVSSVASFLYSPTNANYCATKAYLRVFSEGAALELAGSGVRMQALCPGFFRSEFHGRMALDTSGVPGFLWMTAEAVCDASLAALDRGGPVVVVPGAIYRFIVLLAKLLPRTWIGRPSRIHERRPRAR